MTDTTLTEAARCPFCKAPGKLYKSTRPDPRNRMIPRGTKIDIYECVNDRCANFGERWPIQINPDGTIPPKGTFEHQPKEYDINRVTTEAQRQQARDMLAAEVARSQSEEGSEVRTRRQ